MKILIVDDSKVARMIISRLIHEIDADWEIIEASDGTEAIELARNSPPKAVIMDFNMPGIDGLEAARLVKEAAPDARITMLTANIQKAIKARADEMSIGFLTKPVEKDDIAVFLAG